MGLDRWEHRIKGPPRAGCRGIQARAAVFSGQAFRARVPAEGPAGAGGRQRSAHKPCPSQPAAAQVGTFLLICTEASLESFVLAQGRRHAEETSGKLCRWVELRVEVLLRIHLVRRTWSKGHILNH